MSQRPTNLPALDMAALPDRLRELRQQRQLTQIRIAELVGVGIRVYHRWENGGSTPHFDALLRLADVLNVSLDELTGREPMKEGEQIHNHDLHQLVRQVDRLSDDDQRALIAVMDGLVKRTQISKMARANIAVPKARGPRRSGAGAR